MKRRYTIAKEIFKEYNVPLSHVIMLFADLYPESFIKNLISMFDIKVKEIPYHELLVIGGKGNEANYQKRAVDPEKRVAMREFLTFFLKKRSEIMSKVEEINKATSIVQN